MKIRLFLHREFTIDTSKDLDEEVVKEAAEDLGFDPDNLGHDEWHDIIRHLLEEDISQVVDLSDLDDGDFGIQPQE